MAYVRNGSVLSQGMMLKADHVKIGEEEDAVNTSQDVLYNFQKLPGMNAYGVASPTVLGIRSIFKQIFEGLGSSLVVN